MISIVISSVILLLTIVYSTFATYKNNKEFPESLSETSYILKPWLFVAFCDIVGILLMIMLMNITEDKYQFLPFIACIGFIFAGNSPLYRTTLTKDVHYAFAILSYICFIAYLVCFNFHAFLAYLAIMIFVFIKFRKSIVFFAEILAIYALSIIIFNS